MKLFVMRLFAQRLTIVSICMIIFCSDMTMAACSSSDLGNSRVDLNLNGTIVVLLGWEHITDQETEVLVETLERGILGNGDAKSCGETNQDLDFVVAQMPSTFNNYSTILIQIEEFVNNHEGAQIAIEMTPEELRSHYDGIARFNNKISRLKGPCDKDFQVTTQKILDVLYGPEYKVAIGKAIPLTPVEDQDIKNENAKAFANPDTDTFDFENPQISVDGLAAIDQIRTSIMNQTYPSQELLDRVVEFESDPVKRKGLKSELASSVRRGWEQIVGAYRRNDAIANKLLEANTPKILPIGFRHVEDLKEKLLKKCRQD